MSTVTTIASRIPNRFLLPGDIVEGGATVLAAHPHTVDLGTVTVAVHRVVFELDGQVWIENRPPEGDAIVLGLDADIRARFRGA